MVQEPVIVEISSDEEDEVICKSGAEPLNFYSSMDWLDSMLRLDSDPWISGDMDVVKDLSWPPQEEELAIVPYVAEQCVSNNDSDDDCIILDGDPDKPAEAILEKPDCVDELVIVSEKGPVGFFFYSSLVPRCIFPLDHFFSLTLSANFFIFSVLTKTSSSLLQFAVNYSYCSLHIGDSYVCLDLDPCCVSSGICEGECLGFFS